MDRRMFLNGAAVLAATPLLKPALALADIGTHMTTNAKDQEDSQESFTKLSKPEKEWRPLLNEKEYDVLFDEATERPHSSPLNAEKRNGTFVCAACYLPLFSSETKFESGTGWPSFYASLPGRVESKRDFKMIIPRTEYHCARCGGHQGHIFGDGPRPTGKRYCNNGIALRFVAQGEKLPPLRG
ncbi:MAG: peptide-methionine (R)-S-oxide reductase MsrB [Anaerolineae bacterium]|nr:peptide-methionine (R)-S-oxide reductase MsrB [Gemmatimonadaceae bacterium]